MPRYDLGPTVLRCLPLVAATMLAGVCLWLYRLSTAHGASLASTHDGVPLPGFTALLVSEPGWLMALPVPWVLTAIAMATQGRPCLTEVRGHAATAMLACIPVAGFLALAFMLPFLDLVSLCFCDVIDTASGHAVIRYE